jgi:HK97 family phage major capsid protein
MELDELKGLRADIETGVSETITKKYDEQLGGLHVDLKAAHDLVEKMQKGGYGRIDAQDRKQMDPLVANYFQTEILHLDGIQKAWDSETSGAAAEMIPSEVQTRFLEKIKTYNKLRQYCTIYPSDKGTLFVENAAATNVTVAATRPPNATESAPTFSPVTYSTRGRQVWLAVDEKLVRQSPLRILDIVMTQLAKGLAGSEYAEFITGDNSDNWQGLDAVTMTNADATGTDTATTTVDLASLVAPYWNLSPAYRQGPPLNNVRWITSAAICARMAGLNSATVQYFQFADPENTFLGIPIWEHSSVTTSGYAEPCAYVGDVSNYYIFDKLGTMLRSVTGGQTLTIGHQILVEAYNETDGKLPLAESFTSLTLASS